MERASQCISGSDKRNSSSNPSNIIGACALTVHALDAAFSRARLSRLGQIYETERLHGTGLDRNLLPSHSYLMSGDSFASGTAVLPRMVTRGLQCQRHCCY